MAAESGIEHAKEIAAVRAEHATELATARSEGAAWRIATLLAYAYRRTVSAVLWQWRSRLDVAWRAKMEMAQRVARDAEHANALAEVRSESAAWRLASLVAGCYRRTLNSSWRLWLKWVILAEVENSRTEAVSTALAEHTKEIVAARTQAAAWRIASLLVSAHLRIVSSALRLWRSRLEAARLAEMETTSTSIAASHTEQVEGRNAAVAEAEELRSALATQRKDHVTQLEAGATTLARAEDEAKQLREGLEARREELANATGDSAAKLSAAEAETKQLREELEAHRAKFEAHRAESVLKLSAAETEIAANRERNNSAVAEAEELRSVLATQRKDHVTQLEVGATTLARAEDEAKQLREVLEARREELANATGDSAVKLSAAEAETKQLHEELEAHRAKFEAHRAESVLKLSAAETEIAADRERNNSAVAEAEELRSVLATQRKDPVTQLEVGATTLARAEDEAKQLREVLEARREELANATGDSAAKLSAAEAETKQLREELEAHRAKFEAHRAESVLKLSAAETEIAANRERNKSAEQRTVEVDELRAALAAQRNEHEMRAAPLGAKVAATDEGEVEKLHAALQAQREQAASHVASLSEKVTATETASEELRAQLEAQQKEHAAKILAAETEARELRAALATQQDEDTVGRTKSANDEELLGAKAEADQLGAALDAAQREHALRITASNAKIDAAEAQVLELRAELQALQKHVASAAGGGTASPRAARETQRGEHPVELTLTFDKLSVEQFDAQMQSDFLSELASGLGLVDSNDPAGPHIKLRKCAAGSLVVHCTVHGLPSSAAAAKVREIAARGQLLDASHWGSYRCVVAEGSDDRALIAAAPFIRTRMTDAPVRVAVPTATPRANSRIVSPRASTENWDRVRHDEATVAPTGRVRSAQRMRIDGSAKWAMPRQEQARSSKSARHIEATLPVWALNSVPQCDDNSAQSSSIECARINQTAKRIEALLARKGSDVENMAPEKAPEKTSGRDDEQSQRKKLSAHIWTKLAEVEPNHDDAGNNAHIRVEYFGRAIAGRRAHRDSDSR